MKRCTEVGRTIRNTTSHETRMEGGFLMKRFAIVVAGCLLAFAATATAGDYHTGASLVCSDCHVAHYSQSHNYGGSAFP
ncbi:MAG: hypothetical protein AABZ94_02925, partial [Candidatus Eisenbacteria bacterium]